MIHWSRKPFGLRRVVDWGTGGVMILAVGSLLAGAGCLAWQIGRAFWQGHPVAALLDPILLLVVLAELLHTLALTLKTHHLPFRPVMAVVFMALVRHAVVLVTTGPFASADGVLTLLALAGFSVLLSRLPAQDAD